MVVVKDSRYNLMPSEETDSITLSVKLQTILRGIISFTTIIYAIGFLIVNSYYATFGIIDYQLVQTRYIAAGLSFLFMHFGVAAMVAVIAIVLERVTNLVWMLIALGIWGLFGVTVYLLSRSTASIILVGINAGIISLIGHQIWATWTGMPRTWYHSVLISKGIAQQPRMVFLGVGLTILVCISALSWGWSFWPIMSSTLGGGRPNEAIFIFDTKRLPTSGLPLVPMQNDAVSKQLPVLFENSNEYVVLTNVASRGSTAVRIPKSIVLSVIYARSGLAGQKQALPTLMPSSIPIATPVPSLTPTRSPMPTGTPTP